MNPLAPADDWRVLLGPRYLLHPSTLLLLGANFLPIIGVIAWRWDAFVLLMLYWMETAIIAFWSIARIAVMPRGALGNLQVGSAGKTTSSSSAFAAFFVLHAGLFMAVHFLFLWMIFSGHWAKTIRGPVAFVEQLVIARGLWVPLIVLFLARGAWFLFHILKPDLLASLARRLRRDRVLKPKPLEPADDPAFVVISLYGRIILMQFAVIFGATLSLLIGTLAPLLVLIVLKTFVDVAFQVLGDLGNKLQAKVTTTSSLRTT